MNERNAMDIFLKPELAQKLKSIAFFETLGKVHLDGMQKRARLELVVTAEVELGTKTTRVDGQSVEGGNQNTLDGNDTAPDDCNKEN